MSAKEQHLFTACNNGDLATVKSLLTSSDCDPEIRDKQGNTPLHIACRKGYLPLVRFLVQEKGCGVNCLAKHCHLNAQNKNGDSPLHIACHYKFFDIIKFLLQQRCDTTVQNKRGQSPQTIPLNENGDLLLHIACQWGDVGIVRYLVCEQQCEVNIRNKNGDSLLHVACYSKALVVIKFLLEKRCHTSSRNDSRGVSPQTIPLNKDGDLLLHMACRWMDLKIVKYLVNEQHCDVNVRNENGDSPLHVACYNKALDIIKFLLRQRCDTMFQNKRGQSPQTIPLNDDGDLLLHIACHWEDVDIVRYLVCKQRCNVIVQNKNGDSPLHIACHYKAFDIIKFLLQQRCDTTVQNKRGQSPQTIPLNEDGDLLLHIACQWEDVEIVGYLVRKLHCDVNVRKRSGDSPLHIACWNKSLDIIKFLLRQRCDTRVQNKRGQSPQTIPLNGDGDRLLHIACRWGDVDIVRYLVCEQHCHLNAQNKNGDSSLHIACYRKALDIIKFLLQQRCNTRVQNKRDQSPQTIPLNENGDLLLHIACQWWDVDIVRYLVCEQHCDLNVQNENGDSPLHSACYYKSFNIIKFLLQQRCDTRVQNKRGQSPQTIPLNENCDILLHIACQWGDVDIVRYLVCEQHCDVIVQNKNGDSPLHIACHYKAFDIIKFLLQQRCDTTVQNKRGQSPQTIPLNEDGDLLLHIACQWGDVEIVGYLVRKLHCDVNVRKRSGDSPLHSACYGKALDIIKFLLRQRCDTRVQNKRGQSPQTIPLNEDGDLLLHIACQWGDVDIVRYLVCEQHCDVNVQNKNGDSPLHSACYGKALDIIKFLLRQRCDTRVQNKRGQSPQTIPLNEDGDLLLHIACQWEVVNIVRYLVCEQHCDLNAQNKNGDSSLHIACYRKALDIIKLLLQQRCNTRVQNQRGQSPQTIPLNENCDPLLHIACQWADVDIVRYLVCEQRCNVIVQNKNGDSPLHIACHYKAFDIIKFLLQQRCDTTVRNKRGQSPQTIPLNEDGDLLLHIACQWGDVEIVGYLVCELHCDVNVRKRSGDSPLHIACCNKSLDIIKFLLRQRCDTRVQNKRGQSPQTTPLNEDGDLLLHFACQWWDADIVRYLVCEQHCDVNVQNKNGDSHLHSACYGKALDIIRFLLRQRCDTRVQNKRGQSPQTIPLNEDGDLLLHIACQWGDVDIVRYLVCEQHCDVNAQNKNGDSPLHSACYGKALDVIKFLLQQRCDTTVQNKRGQSPQTIPLNENCDLLLHIACQWGDVDIVRYLVCEQHCDVNAQNKNGDSSLHIACYRKAFDIIKFLLQQRCDTRVQNQRGQSPQTIPLNENCDLLLHNTCQWWDVDIVRYLVCEQHCDVNAQNENGDSSLHIACSNKSLDIIKFLLQQRGDTTVRNKRGQSPQTISLNEDGDLLLHIACQWGDVDIMRYLVCEQHCHLNAQNKNGDSSLHIACYRKALDIIKFLLQQRCNTRVQNKRDQSPQTIHFNMYGDLLLHIACQWWDVDILRYLVCEQHCDLNVQNENGDSPLHSACYYKSFNIIKFLLQQRCDTRVQNKRGQTPQTISLNQNCDCLLHIACQWGDMDIMRYLVCEQHCDVNAQNENGDLSLHIGCSNKSLDIIKFLLQQRCDTSVRNKRGQSPQTIPLNEDGDLLLHIACQWGDVDIVRYLVCEQHCHLNVQNKNGDSSLHIACYGKALDIIKFLLQQRGDITVRNKRGQSPQTISLNEDGDLLLHIACQWGDVDIVRYLVCEQHCDVNAQNENGDSSLHIACSNKSLDIIKFLLQQRGDTTVRNKRGQSPQTISLNEDGDLLLHIACQWEDVDIMRYLVCEQHCHLNAQNKNGDSSLHIACYRKALDIIKFLLQQRCNTRVQNKRDQSPQTIHFNMYGDLLLHIACQWWDVDIVRYLVCEQHCDLNVQNENGDSPLHSACYYKSFNIIKFLLQQRCDTRVQNKRGQTPQTILLNQNCDCLLHIACQWGDMDIMRYLVCEQHCDVNAQNENGDLSLHIACSNKSLDIIKFLLQQRCDTSVRNKRGQSPQTIPLNEDGDLLLHIACQWGDVDIVRYLVCEQHCDVNAQNKNGDSSLHIACYNKSFNIIKFLLPQRCDTIVRNKRGQSPQTIPLNEDGDLLIHVACQWGDVDIVRYLVCEQHCDVQNENGDSPLHIACYYKSLDIIKFLLQQRCDTRVQNKRGQTPQTIPLNEDGDLLLHIACQWGDVDIVRYLVCKQYCDMNVQNKKGASSLHVSIVSCQPSTAIYLLQHKQCNPTLPDSDGNTPLHLACTIVDRHTEMLQVARFLLSSTDLSACVNNAGQTPVELTTNYQLVQNISHITKCKTKHSIQTYVKMFFIGNPSTGKSTLVKAICSESSWWWTLLPCWLRKVRNVSLRTAGIIPITFRSKKFGNTVLYDMAGQYEYYTSHAAVIENSVLSSPPAFIVVVDLSESDDKIMERLKYWWSFVDNHAARSIVPPHVILIGSHADVIKARGVSVQEKMSTISSALRGLSSSFHFVGQVALDCRDPVSSELDQFCSLVDQSCTALRQTVDIDLRCHVAYSFLLEKFEGRVACTLSEIAAQITATDTLLPQSPDQLARLMSSLSDKGIVLLVRASASIEDSLVILQKQELLNEFNGTIFAPENFREHKDFARSTGVVPFSRIKQEFSQHDPAVIVGFLTHLEFCFKIDDPETIKRIEDEAPKGETSLDLSDEYYFFPALVSVDTPHQVWQPDDSMQHQCGWYYKCHPDLFLTSRFLHVLILRLAFSFALGLDKYHPSQRAPVLCRRCSVWKHGLGWLQDGIETVVEVGLQCQWVNVMMRCLKGKEVNCVQLRSAVIQEIKSARNELCKAVKMTEMVIHPSDVHYPFGGKEVSLYSLTDMANAIAKKETHIVDQQSHNSSKNQIPLCDLVIFEPYLGISPECLNELFHQDNSDKLVSETFLKHLASHIRPQMSLFEEVIDPQPAIDYQEELEKQTLPASKCLILLQWLLRKLESPTYENFHKELDKYSIFCGTNPLEVSEAIVVASIPRMELDSSSDPDRAQHTQPRVSELADSISEETPILKDLMNLPIPSWYSLGLHLGIPPSNLKTIQANGAQFPDFDVRCTGDMFQWWLDNDGSPTYRSLVKGLMAAGMTNAIRHIHSKYAAPPSQ